MDFKNISDENQKFKDLNKTYLKELKVFNNLNYIFKKIRDGISSQNYKLFYDLKTKGDDVLMIIV